MTMVEQREKLTLLAVDDRPDNLYVLEQLIANGLPDCTVLTATSAADGLALAQSTHVDGALVDVQMPEMDGIAMCRRMKSHVSMRHIHVILLTAHEATGELRTKGLDAGADDFIGKPIDNAELLARVNVMLRIRRAEVRLRELNGRLDELVESRTRQLNDELARRADTEAVLRTANQTLALRNKCSRAIHGATDERNLAQDICRLMAQEGGYRLTWIGFSFSDDCRSVQAVASSEDVSINFDAIDSVHGSTGAAGAGIDRAMESGRPEKAVAIHTTSVHEGLRPAALAGGYVSSLILPLMVGTRALGVLSIYSASACAFESREEELLIELASDVAHGFSVLRKRKEHLLTQADLARKQRTLELNQRIAEAFLSSPPEGPFGDVTTAIVETVGCETGFFGYVSEAGDLSCTSVKRDLTMDSKSVSTRFVFPRASWDGLWKRSLNDRRSFIANEGIQLCDGKITFDSAIAVPILHEATLVGLFVAANRAGGFDARDQELLESAAGQTAPVLSALLEKTLQARTHEGLKEQFRQSQKMEAVGRLAGGVAHDYNNILTVINSYGAFALDALVENDPIRQDIQHVLDAAERAAVLTRQLLIFSRKQIVQPIVLDLNTVVADMDKMLRRIIGEDIKLQVSLAESLGLIKVDRGQMEQVLMNLVVNARDAMPDGGKLTVETASTELEHDYFVDKGVDMPTGSYVVLVVTDTGGGMRDEVKHHIFEPFFTTKPEGEGTGLGLSTVYGIAKQNGGCIWVYSEAGHGTTFKIYIPKNEATEVDVAPVSTPHVSLAGDETILLVEDDTPVREGARRILVKAGYTVIGAQNGGEAFLIAEDIEREIDLMITDVVMPMMSGRVLAGRLADMRPTMPVLFMSGYTGNALEQHGMLDEGMVLLEKPFVEKSLLLKVRQILDARVS